jgi:hypothetical protein
VSLWNAFAQIPENLSVLANSSKRATSANTAISAAGPGAVRGQPSNGKGGNLSLPGTASGSVGANGIAGGDVGDDSPEHQLWTVLGKKGMVLIKHGKWCRYYSIF